MKLNLFNNFPNKKSSKISACMEFFFSADKHIFYVKKNRRKTQPAVIQSTLLPKTFGRAQSRYLTKIM